MLAELLDKAEPVIVGLWRFRRANEKTPQWCTTWRHKGNYYDTYPKPSPVLALKAMLRNWKEVRERAGR